MTSVKIVEFQCEKHGKQSHTQAAFAGRYVPEPHCPVCKVESIQSREDATQERRSAELDRMKRDKVERARQAADIPARFTSRSFDNFQCDSEEKQKKLEICKAYAEDFPLRKKLGQGLVFCGEAGTGKTHLACAIANYIMDNHIETALYLTASRAFRMVKDTYRKDSEISESEAIRKFRNPSLLIIDEIGIQYGSQAELNILFEIINERYESVLPTILISNLGFESLKEFLGDRVIDRMREGNGKFVIFNWKSHRMQQ